VVNVCTFESRTQRHAGALGTISWRAPRDKSRLKHEFGEAARVTLGSANYLNDSSDSWLTAVPYAYSGPQMVLLSYFYFKMCVDVWVRALTHCDIYRM